jgi:hypothetical protein
MIVGSRGGVLLASSAPRTEATASAWRLAIEGARRFFAIASRRAGIDVSLHASSRSRTTTPKRDARAAGATERASRSAL